MSSPNVLLIMTDEERYAPPYEDAAMADFRRTQLTARERLRSGGVELHRHYAGSTACTPSRATLFTGQYPSFHGVSQTSGLAKTASDPAMGWLDPDEVPTLGDWFRAGGYRTHYRGKWHVSHADLLVPGSHEGLMASDVDGTVLADAVVELFDELVAARDEGPWLAVASFVNPHDIAFAGGLYELIIGTSPADDTVPDVPEAPSQADGFDRRPACHEQFVDIWPRTVAPQPADQAYRQLYYHLHRLVDAAIGRILDALERSGLADDTIVVFTSDHGDLLGAHGGMQQKWYNAYDEAIRVPMLVKGPGVVADPAGLHLPTSHVDLVPTLMGLAGIDVERAASGVAEHHSMTAPLPGRDLSDVLAGRLSTSDATTPIYFMTDDDVTRGRDQENVLTGEHFDAVSPPSRVESVIAELATGDGGAPELWKLNRYFERMDDWDAEHGLPTDPFAGPAAEPFWELHNLTVDPEERTNVAPDGPAALGELQSLLDQQREAKRLVPTLHNP
jgi:arylsulfatase A-like enzyme